MFRRHFASAMNVFARFFSAAALFVGGWRDVNYETVEELTQPCRKVAVIAHTSYWDFFWGLMYGINYGIIHKVRFAMAPKVYDKYGQWPVVGNWIRKTCIRVTPKEESNGGSVKEIVDILNDMDDFIFMIAPAGTRTDDSETHWRTGFIHIAQGTNAKLCVLGVDYSRHHHTCIMKKVESPVDESLCLPNSEVRQLVSEYHSLNSMYKNVYNFDPVTVSTFCPFLYSLTIFWLSFFGYLPISNLDVMLVSAITFAISAVHHSIGESNLEIMDMHTKLMVVCHVWWFVSIYTTWSVVRAAFYGMNSLLLVCLYGFFLSGGHIVGWTENDVGEIEYMERDEFFEEMSTYYNMLATSMMLCLTKV